MSENIVYKKKDFISDQEVRWCPGCGDYSILSSVQMALTKIGRKKEDIVFVSGIGCSSRFPYYMNTYGMHTIHGRAPGFASGLKSFNDKLSVWIITGDGDSLSIGGNHLIHVLRRNVNLNIILFNNEIYGLTKGQYSPTTARGTVTKSSPYGSIDRSFNPAKLALGAGASFYARTMDTDPKHMTEMFIAAEEHQGTSLVEVMQNCVIFNDKIHDQYTNRKTRDEFSVMLENGRPLIFGENKDKGIIIEGCGPKVVNIGENGVTEDKLLVHDVKNENLSFMLSSMVNPEFPMPMGVFRKVEDVCYDSQINEQIQHVKESKGEGSVKKLLFSGNTWEVK